MSPLSVSEQNEPDAGWRDQVSNRLTQYRSRRKPSPPRYPSLLVPFRGQQPGAGAYTEPARYETSEPGSSAAASHTSGFDDRPAQGRRITQWDFKSNVALAPASTENEATQPSGRMQISQEARLHSIIVPTPAQPLVHQPGKIIEFPRPWTPPPAPANELAEPVLGRPRILEAPEFAPPPPALGGITIEASAHAEAAKRPGVDVPLQSAPLGRRLLAAAIDGVIISTASAFFALIFGKVAGDRPPLSQLAGLGLGLTCLFWAAYQYLLVVHSASTPGTRLAGLELIRFDGHQLSMGTRRWRVLASFLSAASLGMGYAWVFLDEDSLCWHDRITRTYLAAKRPARR